METIEKVMDFTVELSRRMLESGANLERSDLAAESVLRSYGLQDISIFSLATYVRISARTQDGTYCSRQCSVPDSGIELERLSQLNSLSFQVCREKPDPDRLQEMLDRASVTKPVPQWALLLGQEVALFPLCMIMGGNLWDSAAVAVLTLPLFFLQLLLSKTGLTGILRDILNMFAATVLAVFAIRHGLGDHLSWVLITLCFALIPGIPMVNSVRNFLCGKELNGILQLCRVVLESLALIAGMFLGIFIMGGEMPW